MHRPANYSYPPATSHTTHRHSSSSSAFSANANPNEDWTKISDLAERRRIQNRIAQRNYRKKLKKRLEDLERRAGSTSASPEQRPVELEQCGTPPRDDGRQYDNAIESIESHDQHPRSAEVMSYHHQYQPFSEERGMFSHQYTRQLSTSPPPFSYSLYTTQGANMYPYNYHANRYTVSGASSPDLRVQSPYVQSHSPSFTQNISNYVQSVKHEYYGDQEISPFSMNYASMAGIDIPNTHSNGDPSIHTPPLSESFEASTIGSPHNSIENNPRTPSSMPRTPPYVL